jgi:hypothetical protein
VVVQEQLLTNTTVPSTAGGAYYVPNAAGRAVPTGQETLKAEIDLVNLTNADHIEFSVEYSFDAGATWYFDSGASLSGGSYTPKSGIPTTLNYFQSAIPVARGYPDLVRIHVTDNPTSFVSPSVTFWWE